MNYVDVAGVKAQFHEGRFSITAEQQETILGIVSYIADETIVPNDAIVAQASIPHLCVHIPADRQVLQSEIWYGAGAIARGKWEGIDFSHDAEHLFGAVCYDVGQDLIHADRTEQVFRNIFRLIRNKGYANLYRMWSYIPGLNQDNVQNIEIYKDFCYGRSAAFSGEFPESMGEVVPAATGIGSSAQQVAVYFLAKKTPDMIHVENPMQVPAYHYPPKYGAKAPSFSRATYVPVGELDYRLYLSGTASVVGHSSHHWTDVEKQCETTLLNIQRLIDPENLRRYGIYHSIDLSELDVIKVYIRHQQDFAAVQRICAAFFRPDVAIIYLHADICRKDLLMELEGIFSGKKRDVELPEAVC